MNVDQIIKFKNIINRNHEYLLLYLVDESKNQLDIESFEKYISSLNSIIDSNLIVLKEKSKNLSQKMDPDKLTAEQFIEFNESVQFDQQSYDLLKSKFTSLISFEFPVLELFPGKGTFTTEAVAGEPLYIADYYLEPLELVGLKFNDFYNSKRLFKYVIKDFDLTGLPLNQFGLIFSFCYFIVKDIDFIEDWSEEVFKFLRPGGHWLFNFIPNDTDSGLSMSVNHRLASVDHKDLENRLRAIGFEIVSKTLSEGYTSCFIVRKPGELKSLKLSSSLALIIEK